MKGRRVILGLLLLSSALVITTVLAFGGRQASGQSEATDSISRINDKAATLNTADETQVRDLAEEIFKAFQLDEAPPEIAESVKERLVRAELNYRSGRGKPVSEFGVVRMTNMLADKLGAPAYAKTNVFEVRRLEMNFLPFLSKLIGNKPAGESNGPKPLGSSINPTLSPLEAITIAGLLIQQKRFSPEYQMTQDEWIANQGGKRHPKNFASSWASKTQHEKRGEKIEEAIRRGTDNLSMLELLELPHLALDKLGVQRADGRAGQ
jgi:hypothetical protein